jgi:hypothetical protein
MDLTVSRFDHPLEIRNSHANPIIGLLTVKSLVVINSSQRLMTRLEREQVLRLFQQLHQDMDDDWYRASGEMYCEHCGLQYRNHPIEEFFNIDRRLCNGETVHL